MSEKNTHTHAYILSSIQAPKTIEKKAFGKFCDEANLRQFLLATYFRSQNSSLNVFNNIG